MILIEEKQISIAKKYNINRSIVSRLLKKYKSTRNVDVATSKEVASKYAKLEYS